MASQSGSSAIAYGDRDYTGFVPQGSPQHDTLCHLYVGEVSATFGKYFFNGRALFLAVSRRMLGTDKIGFESLGALVCSSRAGAGALHFLVSYHVHIMRLAEIGQGPLAHIMQRGAQESSDEDG